MRTTIDLPDVLFREVKTQAVRQGTTLKKLICQYIRSGLRAQPVENPSSLTRRNPPPVAIRRIPGQPPVPARTNQQLNAILEEQDVSASRVAESRSQHRL